MGGIAPANQLRLSFTGSEDGEAETETCRAAKPLWRTTSRTSGPQGLNLLNRRMRTRLYGGVGGVSRGLLPLSRYRWDAVQTLTSKRKKGQIPSGLNSHFSPKPQSCVLAPQPVIARL